MAAAELKTYAVIPMSPENAVEISKWTYNGPYAIYSFTGDREAIDELLENEYYAVLGGGQELIGYYCFGISARIPTADEKAYEEKALDIGLGLRPDLCGKGLGSVFLCQCLKFAEANLSKNQSIYRLTVAEFNKRAIIVYQRAGFVCQRRIEHKMSCQAFVIMTRVI